MFDVPIAIERKQGRKHLLLEVRPEGVLVKSPLKISQKTILAFIETNQRWLIEKWQLMPKPLSYQTADEIFWLGEKLLLSIMKGPKKIIQDEKTFYVFSNNTQPDIIKKQLQQHYKNYAKTYLINRTQYWIKKIEIPAKSITVKTFKARWGCCDKFGNITLNWRLLAFPIDTIDYVIIHELCHIKEFSHSKVFWQWVSQFCPSYKNHIARLKSFYFPCP